MLVRDASLQAQSTHSIDLLGVDLVDGPSDLHFNTNSLSEFLVSGLELVDRWSGIRLWVKVGIELTTNHPLVKDILSYDGEWIVEADIKQFIRGDTITRRSAEDVKRISRPPKSTSL